MSTTLWASSQILVRAWMTNHLCWKLELGVSRIFRNIYLKNISTWYFRWALNFIKNDKNIASKSSNTSQILETPFLDSDTHKYCFTAEMNISLDLKTGPAFWTTDNIRRSNWQCRYRKMQTGIGASPLPLFEYIIPVVTIITILDVSHSKTDYFQIAALYYIFQNLVYPTILFFLFLPDLHHQ